MLEHAKTTTHRSSMQYPLLCRWHIRRLVREFRILFHRVVVHPLAEVICDVEAPVVVGAVLKVDYD